MSSRNRRRYCEVVLQSAVGLDEEIGRFRSDRGGHNPFAVGPHLCRKRLANFSLVGLLAIFHLGCRKQEQGRPLRSSGPADVTAELEPHEVGST